MNYEENGRLTETPDHNSKDLCVSIPRYTEFDYTYYYNLHAGKISVYVTYNGTSGWLYTIGEYYGDLSIYVIDPKGAKFVEPKNYTQLQQPVLPYLTKIKYEKALLSKGTSTGTSLFLVTYENKYQWLSKSMWNSDKIFETKPYQ